MKRRGGCFVANEKEASPLSVLAKHSPSLLTTLDSNNSGFVAGLGIASATPLVRSFKWVLAGEAIPLLRQPDGLPNIPHKPYIWNSCSMPLFLASSHSSSILHHKKSSSNLPPVLRAVRKGWEFSLKNRPSKRKGMLTIAYYSPVIEPTEPPQEQPSPRALQARFFEQGLAFFLYKYAARQPGVQAPACQQSWQSPFEQRHNDQQHQQQNNHHRQRHSTTGRLLLAICQSPPQPPFAAAASK